MLEFRFGFRYSHPITKLAAKDSAAPSCSAPGWRLPGRHGVHLSVQLTAWSFQSGCAKGTVALKTDTDRLLLKWGREEPCSAEDGGTRSPSQKWCKVQGGGW